MPHCRALESTYPGLLMEAGWYLAERVESAAAAEGPLTPAQNGEVSLAALVLSHAAGEARGGRGECLSVGVGF